MSAVSKNKIVLTENNNLDYVLIKDAFAENGIEDRLDRVTSGEELFNYLKGSNVKPSLILLDLNMQGQDGRSCLVQLKSDANYKTIPVIVLTTSNLEKDITFAYLNGASAYIRKPASFGEFVKYVEVINKFWFETVTLAQS